MGRKKEVKLKCYVLLISRYFAKDNRNAGEPTGFIEKIESGEKLHTIRLNYPFWEERFKEINEGKAYLSVRYWTDAPYNSPQETYKNFYNTDGIGLQKLSFPLGTFIDDVDSDVRLVELAKNDGLDFEDFKAWFGDKLTENNGNNDLAIIHFTPFRYSNSKTSINN